MLQITDRITENAVLNAESGVRRNDHEKILPLILALIGSVSLMTACSIPDPGVQAAPGTDKEEIVQEQALVDYLSNHDDIGQKDLKKANRLLSYPCIMKYYPEYKTFNEFKREMLGLSVVHEEWAKDAVVEAGKRFVEDNGKLTEKDLKAYNGLPTSKVIYNFFGTLANYQREIGAPVSQPNEYISKEDIAFALDEYFKGESRVVESSNALFDSFPYSKATVYKRYGSFSKFCVENGISVKNTKKASYSKKEVDDAIHSWIKNRNDIPKAKDLTRLGLPSMSVILKYYEDWKEPFVLYMKIFDEANRDIQ